MIERYMYLLKSSIPQEILKVKFMQQYWEGADKQGVLGNAKITNTCGYINVT